MSTTLSNGYKRPDSGDPGSVWMPEHEENIERLNDHNHDGTNSELLLATNLSRDTSTVLSGSWVDNGVGGYEQTVTTPAAITEINNHLMKVYITSSGVVIYPSIERVTATSYKLTVNDNTLNLTVVYI